MVENNQTPNPIKHNAYFDGMVQSLSLDTLKGKATVGVMKPGKYEFSTSTAEEMVIITGVLHVRLPGSEWMRFKNRERFEIEANQKFEVRCDEDVSYICFYE